MTFIRRHAAGILAILAIVLAHQLVSEPGMSAEERQRTAARFRFVAHDLPRASGVEHRHRRQVHPAFEHMASWISSLGAAVALADLDGDGLPNDIVLVDPRSDRVIVAPVPGTGERYPQSILDPSPLRYDDATMAPMGCVPGDFDEDGAIDVVVYYWGRTPILFLRDEKTNGYSPTELVTTDRSKGAAEARWYTNACTSADFDGDGHVDLFFGNYFADGSELLDAKSDAPGEHMQDSMSLAYNGGRNRILLWKGLQSAPDRVVFRDVSDVLTPEQRGGWTLAAAAADLDGDLLPELYVANDFGPDLLLHNRTNGGKLAFAPLLGRRGLTTAKSCVLGMDSFKGMGADFGDLNGDGVLDIYVSNITTQWGLQETQFCFLSTDSVVEDMARDIAPYRNASEELGLARTGWAWDAKLCDFDNDGVLEAMQATGFLRGEIGRWAELHEVAMANDGLLSAPRHWHSFHDGDDLSGHDPNPFFVRGKDGRFFDLAEDVGLSDTRVSRGIATADVDGDGDVDLAVANQWAGSSFYANESPRSGSFLGLRLLLPLEIGQQTVVATGRAARARGRPAIGATATVRRADGTRLVGQVDGGNGHSGVRSPELHVGLGASDAPVDVALSWRDPGGRIRSAKLRLEPGWHTVTLAWPKRQKER